MKNEIKTKVNILFGLINGVVSTLQTLWFIPYVKSYLGSTAYGYIAVVNGLINTLTIISFAVGSMSARFIVIELDKGNLSEAKKYFNSDFFALIFLGVITSLIGLIICLNINLVMNVKSEFIGSVQLLFGMTLFSFIMQLVETPFSASMYYTNSIYISYVIFILDYLTRILFTVLLYKNGNPVIWSAAIASDVIYFGSLLFYVYYQKRVIPKLKVSVSNFDFSYLKKILGSGLWFSISSAGNTMLSSLNSYFSNILCGVFITGIYSSIMQFNIIENVVLGVLVNSAVSRMFSLYSQKNYDELFGYIIKTMIGVSLILGVASGCIAVFGNDFVTLWLGESFSGYNLMIFLTVMYLPLTLPSQVINQYFSVANKVKIPAIATIIFVLINFLLAILFVKVFDFYIYGVIIASIIVQFVRDNIFYPYYFYKTMPSFKLTIILPYIVSIVVVFVVVSLCNFIHQFFLDKTVLNFFLESIIGGFVSLVFSFSCWKFIKRMFPHIMNSK